jgi:hypothetical protein
MTVSGSILGATIGLRFHDSTHRRSLFAAMDEHLSDAVSGNDEHGSLVK